MQAIRNLPIGSLLALALFSACSGEDITTYEAADELAEAELGELESPLRAGTPELATDLESLLAAPTRLTRLQGDDGPTVRYSVVGGFGVIDGDIIIGDVASLLAQDFEEGAGRRSSGYRWPGGVIPYVLDAGLPSPARVTQAMAHWTERTGIRFVLRTNQTDYVRFRNGTGCSSWVGRIGGEQAVNLHANCSVGATIHEIGHAVGLWHEQSRTDRDTFVTIQTANALAGTEHNFERYIDRGENGVDVSGYDFGSIMHYSPTAFTANGQPTIVINNPGAVTAVVGQRNGLSPGDLLSVGLLYCREPGYVCNVFF